MPSELRHSIVQNTARLAGFAVVAAIILTLFYAVTENRITDQMLAAERQALNSIFPASEHDNDLISDSFIIDLNSSRYSNLELLGLRENSRAYVARKNMQLSGLILPLVARDGYNGDIELLLGINIEGSVTGLRVTAHRETPGLGDPIDLRISDWILSFNNRTLANPELSGWTVKKNGGDFDQFTGATITPRAVTVATAKALEFFEENKSRLLSL
jgi:Na+-translocating ferredoxin:NAD+ oxidoreductase subunit G